MTIERPDDPVEALRRWEAFGGRWEVVHETSDDLVISLRRCDGGEEAGRLVSADLALRAYVERR